MKREQPLLVWRERARRGIDMALIGVASALAIALLVVCFHDVSQGYDVWYYHLPFAARLAGIMDAKVYAFSAENQARYEGFPLFAEMLQGALWRVTGHVTTTSLLSLASLFGVTIFLRRSFRVPLHLSWLALLAIPLVHIHATQSYVDLIANACVVVLLLCVWRVLVANAPPTWRFLLGCGALAAAAANTKFQLVPIIVVAAAVLLFMSLRDVRRWRDPSTIARSDAKRRLAVMIVAIPIVFATPIKNVALHGNPVWPIELRILGRSLPHVEDAYESSPPLLQNSTRPVRFVRSILELDNLPMATRRRWTIDQWAPADDPSCRMGGYFGAYVIVNLAALAWITWRRRTREALVGAALFGGVTVIASVVPQSHELRYYMHWMMLLVCMNLVLWTREAHTTIGLVALAAVSVVTWATGAVYLYPSGVTLDEFIAKHVERSIIEGATRGERLCIDRRPFDLLYASTFRAVPDKRDYTIQEATTADDCKGARRVP